MRSEHMVVPLFSLQEPKTSFDRNKNKMRGSKWYHVIKDLCRFHQIAFSSLRGVAY